MKATVLASAIAMTLASGGCKTPSQGSGGSSVKEAIDGSSLPNSIHGNPLPLGKQPGVVVEISAGLFGVSSSVKRAATAFTDQLKAINTAQKAANKPYVFVALAIDAGALGGLAGGQIAAEDRTAVADAVSQLGIDEATAQSQVVLFFNDSDKTIKNALNASGGNPNVTVIDASGAVTGTYNLPGDVDAAVAAVKALTQN